METTSFLDSSLFQWFLMPFLIFCARILDVSIGTVRIILLSRGMKYIAPIIGFFEVLIWLLAFRQIINNLNNFATYIGFAGGFATGNYVGIWLEEKLAMGKEVIRIITKKEGNDLVNYLKKEGHGVTVIEGQGATGKVHIIFTIVDRRDHHKIINAIQKFNPKAFYSVDQIRSVSEGVFPCKSQRNFDGLGDVRIEK